MRTQASKVSAVAQQPLQIHYLSRSKDRTYLRMSPMRVLSVATLGQKSSSIDPLIAIGVGHSQIIYSIVSLLISHLVGLLVSPMFYRCFVSLQCPLRKPFKSRRFFSDICRQVLAILLEELRRWSWSANSLFCLWVVLLMVLLLVETLGRIPIGAPSSFPEVTVVVVMDTAVSFYPYQFQYIVYLITARAVIRLEPCFFLKFASVIIDDGQQRAYCWQNHWLRSPLELS